MFKRKRNEAWKDAIGVLPLDVVLAEEHDRLHGDDVRRRQDAIPLDFAPEQIRDVANVARALRDARLHLQGKAPAGSIETPLDRAAGFVLGPTAVGASDSTDLLKALVEYLRNPNGAEEAAARLRAAFAGRLNELLGIRLFEVAVFAPLVEQVAIDALGDADEPRAVRLANRLLLEATFPSYLTRYRDIRLSVLYAAVRCKDTAALCLSGGGIRSATFALGVVTGLARAGVLGKFDYLSTVSGGGYIGSWLSAWMRHAGARSVQDSLARPPESKLEPEPEPLRYLRAYARYLSPRAGLMTADTWTLAATIARNLLLNWMVLLPLLAAGILLPRIVTELLHLPADVAVNRVSDPPAAEGIGTIFSVLLIIGTLLGAFAITSLHRARASFASTSTISQGRGSIASQNGFLLQCILPLVTAVALLAGVWYTWWSFIAVRGGYAELLWGLAAKASEVPRMMREQEYAGAAASMASALSHGGWIAILVIVFAILVHLVGWYVGTGRQRRRWREVFPMLLSGMLTGVLGILSAIWFVVSPRTAHPEAFFATFGVPVLLTVLLVGSQFFTGLISAVSSAAEREWAARFNAWLLIVIVFWTGFFAVVLYGPALFDDVLQQRFLAAVGGISGVATVLLGAGSRSRSSAATENEGRTGGVRSLALAMAAPVFVAVVVISISVGNQKMLDLLCFVPRVTGCEATRPDANAIRRAEPLYELARDRTTEMQKLSFALTRSTGLDSALSNDTIFKASTIGWLARALDVSDETDTAEAFLRTRATDIQHLAAEAIRVDYAVMDTSSRYTRVALAVDSALSLSGGGGSANEMLWDVFYDRRFVTDSIDALIGERFGRRDSLMAAAFAASRQLDSTLRELDHAVSDSLRASLLTITGAMRARIESGLRSELAMRRDSTIRAASLARTGQVMARIADLTPGPAAAATTGLALLLILLVIGRTLGRWIDTNEFSLHGMYHSRIVRTFLGASRPAGDRNPHPFTGFDPGDDFPVGRLWSREAVPDQHGPARSEDSPPLHVVNVALNLVSGRNLAWQQRKAGSMSISPLHAGTPFLGYRRTSVTAGQPPAESVGRSGRLSMAARILGATAPVNRLYGGDEGITLGTAVTISGAAASPNSGYHSSPLVTFLMTLFNARLGWWLGNPGPAGRDTFDLRSPRQKITPILSEMFGMTNDRSEYVYLSDGGHFENLALYEMVLRRCRFIVVSDAGCDPDCTFEDLGNAVRKIRVDLGVEIEFVGGLDIRARNQPPGQHWAVGRIRYSAVDLAPDANPDDCDGVLLYLKPAINGTEPRDVVNYANTNPTFPHESTTDQFFTESQFESYRALGEHVAREVVRAAGKTPLSARGQREGSLLQSWPTLRAPDAVRVPDAGGYMKPLTAVAPTT